ncbi:hypothetical protein ACMA1I_20160 [Pontibacter sp. 13R65]|uniref:hypothetical protein n=1 Tax=Pontibacter sp. 13R65 TaxID=3127458 RepID=UPI00301E4B3F
MELGIKPHPKSLFPLQGILVKGAAVSGWLYEIQGLRLSLQNLAVYPIPDTRANSIWGCLLVTEQKLRDIGRHQHCQLVHHMLFIPEKSCLQPAITETELKQLCAGNRHALHPDFGLVALEEAVVWENILQSPIIQNRKILKPAKPIFIPATIKSFQLAPVPPAEVLRKLEEEIFPKKEKLEDKPLSVLEKAKLFLYSKLLPQRNSFVNPGKATGLVTTLLLQIAALLQKLIPINLNWLEELQEDKEDLEKRNQKQLDKLLDLLKNNPTEALKYAIPLDNNGTTRGKSGSGRFELTTRWYNFLLFGQGAKPGSGGSVDIGDDMFHALQQQYSQTAQVLTEKQDYQQAAFVYMKLLKNYTMAAQTLEKGHLYPEAASVYLKYCHSKTKAADCYDKGNMTLEAIELYKDLNENEKVGDLYLKLQKSREADIYFGKVAATYESKNQYVKAALIYRNKMNNTEAGQAMLLEGWRANQDACNCLNTYFANIADTQTLGREIAAIYANEVNPGNSEKFLQVIRYPYKKQPELAENVRELAYEIIASQLTDKPALVSELRHFNPPDKELVKDTIRFKVSQRK